MSELLGNVDTSNALDAFSKMEEKGLFYIVGFFFYSLYVNIQGICLIVIEYSGI